MVQKEIVHLFPDRVRCVPQQIVVLPVSNPRASDNRIGAHDAEVRLLWEGAGLLSIRASFTILRKSIHDQIRQLLCQCLLLLLTVVRVKHGSALVFELA